jgi:hypothetical protein
MIDDGTLVIVFALNNADPQWRICRIVVISRPLESVKPTWI